MAPACSAEAIAARQIEPVAGSVTANSARTVPGRSDRRAITGARTRMSSYCPPKLNKPLSGGRRMPVSLDAGGGRCRRADADGRMQTRVAGGGRTQRAAGRSGAVDAEGQWTPRGSGGRGRLDADGSQGRKGRTKRVFVGAMLQCKKSLAPRGANGYVVHRSNAAPAALSAFLDVSSLNLAAPKAPPFFCLRPATHVSRQCPALGPPPEPARHLRALSGGNGHNRRFCDNVAGRVKGGGWAIKPQAVVLASHALIATPVLKPPRVSRPRFTPPVHPAR